VGEGGAITMYIYKMEQTRNNGDGCGVIVAQDEEEAWLLWGTDDPENVTVTYLGTYEGTEKEPFVVVVG
jgi:hypothetical protein